MFPQNSVIAYQQTFIHQIGLLIGLIDILNGID